VNKLNNPVIELNNYRITNIEYTTFETQEELNYFKDENGTISATVGTTEDNKEARIVISTTILKSDEEQMDFKKVTLEITGYFKINTDENVQEYLRVNGTAILFPYLRTFISVITSLDNSDAIVIPTINTNSFGENSK
jgi:preprotein translocase subunit SecB